MPRYYATRKVRVTQIETQSVIITADDDQEALSMLLDIRDDWSSPVDGSTIDVVDTKLIGPVELIAEIDEHGEMMPRN